MAIPCIKCKSPSHVIDSRTTHRASGVVVRRRRVCNNPECQYRFTTFEFAAQDSEAWLIAAEKAAALRKALGAALKAFDAKPFQVPMVEDEV